jgi:5'-methylthioinosine phosphorylase
MPEAALAREMGMPYAGISVTVNPGPGLAPGEVVLEDIEAAMDQGLAWVKAILLEFMAAAA